MQRARSTEEYSVFGELQRIQYVWKSQCEGAGEIGQVMRLGRLGGVKKCGSHKPCENRDFTQDSGKTEEC